MATKKKVVKKAPAKKTAVKKKAAAKQKEKPAEKKVAAKAEKRAGFSDKELARAEALLFGTPLEKPEAPKKKGIVRTAVVKKKAAEEEKKPKSALKKLAGGRKTRIVRKGAEPEKAPEPEVVQPVTETGKKEEAKPVKSRLLDVIKAAKKEKKEAEAAARKSKVKEEKLEVDKLAPLEESIMVIREDEAADAQKGAVSYKQFKTEDGEEYEEVEEIVEEVIEEVEYEDDLRESSEAIAKKRAEETARDHFGGPRRRRRKKKKKRTETDVVAAKDAVKRTLAQIRVEDTASRKRYRRGPGAEETVEESNVLRVSEFMSVAEIANLVDKKPADVIAACMKLGLMVTINQRLDFDVIAAVIDEFGFKAELLEEYAQEALVPQADDDPKDLEPRSPIVTVMGHVDHGKTSLLDYIRKTNVIATESGGITQHIGAYRVKTSHGPITFLDTPGHEAFATMRARGANITDLVILVIAADSDVMPQTVESIDHAKAAGVRMIVAINKTDLPTADPQRIKTKLTQHGIVVEDMGGPVVAVEISCKTGKNIDKLLEITALEAELLELKANPKRLATGTIIESKLDTRLGVVATVLITNGTLRMGGNFITGSHHGRVKVMMDEYGHKVEAAGPSMPVQVLGLSGTPRAGDSFVEVDSERTARDISVKRTQAEKEKELRQLKHMTLDDLYNEIKIGGVQDVNLIIKGDVDGSVEALSESLSRLSKENLKINIISKGVGAIKESDVLLAATTNAIIIGFHIYPNSKVRELAHEEGVDIRIYKIIYEAVEEMQQAIDGMLAPKEKEVVLGNAEVRNVFKISKVGNVAGSYVTDGKIKRSAAVRILRDGVKVAETRIDTLKRLKDDAGEVNAGFECGIFLENYNDIKVGDVIEAFEIQKVKETT